MKNNVFKDIAKGLLVTVVGFVILEAVLRIVYFGRNWMVTEIPVPYMFGDDHGPIPPWLDSLPILQSDKVLIWKNRTNSKGGNIDLFSSSPKRARENVDPPPVPSPVSRFAKRESNVGNFAQLGRI